MTYKCNHRCGCNYPSFGWMTAEKMLYAIGFDAMIHKTIPLHRLYLKLRRCYLPWAPTALDSWKLAKAIKKHGIFEITPLCQRLLRRAKPKVIHNLFGKVLPNKTGDIVRFRRYSEVS